MFFTESCTFAIVRHIEGFNIMRTEKKRSFSTKIDRRRRVAVPEKMTGWKIGQRVFFSLEDGGIAVTTKPKGLFQGRLFSSRIGRLQRRSKW